MGGQERGNIIGGVEREEEGGKGGKWGMARESWRNGAMGVGDRCP